MNDVIDLKTKLEAFSDTWHPRIIGEANGQYLKLAHGEGTLEWHSHEGEDEVFLCLEGRIVLEMRDREVALEPGQTRHLGGEGGAREISIDEQAWI
jgi:mannose-6-phosphate isomerase-like protein (cupin superfamily)